MPITWHSERKYKKSKKKQQENKNKNKKQETRRNKKKQEEIKEETCVFPLSLTIDNFLAE